MNLVTTMKPERVRDLRKKLGHSQSELASIAEIDNTLISDYERGKGNPTAVTLKALSQALGTSSDYLLGMTDDPTPPSMHTIDHLARLEQHVIELWREGKANQAAMLILSNSS